MVVVVVQIVLVMTRLRFPLVSPHVYGVTVVPGDTEGRASVAGRI
jgi:hypothetical protein